MEYFYIRRHPCTIVSNTISDSFTIEMSTFEKLVIKLGMKTVK